MLALARCVCGAEIKMKVDKPNQQFTVAYASRTPEEAWPIVDNFTLEEVLRNSDHELVLYGKSQTKEAEKKRW